MNPTRTLSRAHEKRHSYPVVYFDHHGNRCVTPWWQRPDSPVEPAEPLSPQNPADIDAPASLDEPSP